MYKRRRLVLMIVAIALATLLAGWFHREMTIDQCLDAVGAWDYANARCEKD